MKNFIIALMIVVGIVGTSYAGDCANGTCTAPSIRPVRKVVNVTKNIVVAPVRAVAAVVTPSTCCDVVATDSCNCGCNATTKQVVKYQPLRRRLVNRTTNVQCCE